MFASVVLAALAVAQPAPTFELKDGDRIVWIGNTLVEREQRYGYWETALHAAFPKVKFTLRNLGWSGDTVFGEARGRFDYANAEKCFRQLVDQTLELKPTVIFVSYGTNESFDGEAGLPKFEKGLNKLLDALKPANARIVLFSPLPAGGAVNVSIPPARNEALRLYSEAIKAVAAKRGLRFADLFQECSGQAIAISDNGMHLNETGYGHTAGKFVHSLGVETSTIRWADLGPLRKAIVEKNQLFFYRWRPQNETYLFGFRKHEQGRNAREVAEFDPLVGKAEAGIEKLRKDLLK